MTALTFHPLADIFPLMEGAEFDALVADIKANGMVAPIVTYEGKIIDGRNRYRACLVLDLDMAVVAAKATRDGDRFITDPVAYIISANIHRRHLTAEQRREVIAKVIAARPEASDRQIAKQVRADHKTVGTIRKKKEATGEVSPVEKRTGADGKVRAQPAKKAAPAKPPAAKPPGRDNIGPTGSGEIARIRARNEELERENHRLKRENLALRSEVEELKTKLAAPPVFGDALDLVARMDGRQRAKFFDLLVEKYGRPMVQEGLVALMAAEVENADAPVDTTTEAPVENAPPPDVGADKAQIAALDEGIPEFPEYPEYPEYPEFPEFLLRTARGS